MIEPSDLIKLTIRTARAEKIRDQQYLVDRWMKTLRKLHERALTTQDLVDEETEVRAIIAMNMLMLDALLGEYNRDGSVRIGAPL